MKKIFIVTALDFTGKSHVLEIYASNAKKAKEWAIKDFESLMIDIDVTTVKVDDTY